MQYFGFDRPIFAFKTYGFGANFDPLDLFAGGKQGVWYDPSDKSTLFQDVAGTVSVTKDGDPVALMKDKSGNGNHATQSLASSRPTYRTDGILHWLQFDGVDDFITVNRVEVFNLVSIASHVGGIGDRVLLSAKDSQMYYLLFSSIGDIATNTTYVTRSPITKPPTVITLAKNNSGIAVLRIDGEVVSNSFGRWDGGLGLTIGARVYPEGSDRFLTGKVFGLVTSEAAADSTSLPNLEGYLMAKSGYI